MSKISNASGGKGRRKASETGGNRSYAKSNRVLLPKRAAMSVSALGFSIKHTRTHTEFAFSKQNNMR